MDDLKISFDNEREINVYEDKGTVVCRMIGVFDQVEYVGYGAARCRPGDKFDREKGIRIATAMAENKIYHQVLKDVRQLRLYARDRIKFDTDLVNACTRFINKGVKTFKHNLEYVKLVDENRVTKKNAKK